MTSTKRAGGSSAPPKACGNSRRNNPCSTSAATTGSVSSRRRSISSAAAVSRGPNARAAASGSPPPGSALGFLRFSTLIPGSRACAPIVTNSASGERERSALWRPRRAAASRGRAYRLLSLSPLRRRRESRPLCGSGAAGRFGSEARRDRADRSWLVDAQDHALADIKLVVNAVLADIAGSQILPDDDDADARIDDDAALDVGLEDAGLAQTSEMIELRYVAAGIEAKQGIVERRLQHQRVGTAEARLVELGHRLDRVVQGTIDLRPVAAGDMQAALDRQQTGDAEILLSAIDEFLLALGDRLGGVLGRRQVERQASFEIGGDAADAELKALAQHRHRDRAAHHGAGLIGLGLAAVIVMADLDRGQPDPERALEIEKPAAGQAIARRLDDGLVDRPPHRLGERRPLAAQIVHRYSPLSRPTVKPRSPRPPPRAAGAAAPCSAAVSTAVSGPSLYR